MAIRNVVYECAKVCMNAGIVPNIVGYTGIGKTDMMKQLATETNRDLIVLNIATQEPGDLIGIPTIIDGQTHWALPCWWPSGERPSILFIDELNRARRDVLNALMPLLLNGELHITHKLPKNVWVCTAMNPDTDDFDMVNSIDDRAILSRMVHLYLDVDKEAWKKYIHESFQTNIPILNDIVDMVCNQGVLVSSGSDPNKTSNVQGDLDLFNEISPNPRSWTRILWLMETFANMDRSHLSEYEQGQIMAEIARGLLGKSIYHDHFMKYLKKYIMQIMNTEAKKTKEPMEIFHDLKIKTDGGINSNEIYNEIEEDLHKLIETKNSGLVIKYFEEMKNDDLVDLILNETNHFNKIINNLY